MLLARWAGASTASLALLHSFATSSCRRWWDRRVDAGVLGLCPPEPGPGWLFWTGSWKQKWTY